MKKYFDYKTTLGNITIAEENGFITDLHYGKLAIPDAIYEETNLIKKAYHQLTEYIKGTRVEFTLPLKLNGSSFQQRVWEALLTIPYGETKTYGEIAKLVGNSKASRAVGMANNHNPIAIIIPCHRVIGKSGKLVGYAGGLDIKESLLDIEKHGI